MLKVGDTITCHDIDDLIKTMTECAKEGVETDFDYSDDKPKLVVTEVKGDRREDELIEMLRGVDEFRRKIFADVVKVTRCENCQHCENRNNDEPYCHYHAMVVTPDYFCADGEKGEWMP